MRDIGKLIRKERIKKGKSIRGLAEEAGCTARAIVYWEAGKRCPTIELADKVLRVLGVRVVIGETEQIKDPRKEGDQ